MSVFISIQSPLIGLSASLMSSWISATCIGNQSFGVVLTLLAVSFKLFQHSEYALCVLYMCWFSLRLKALIDSSRVQSSDPRGSRSPLRFDPPASRYHHLTPTAQVQISQRHLLCFTLQDTAFCLQFQWPASSLMSVCGHRLSICFFSIRRHNFRDFKRFDKMLFYSILQLVSQLLTSYQRQQRIFDQALLHRYCTISPSQRPFSVTPVLIYTYVQRNGVITPLHTNHVDKTSQPCLIVF